MLPEFDKKAWKLPARPSILAHLFVISGAQSLDETVKDFGKGVGGGRIR